MKILQIQIIINVKTNSKIKAIYLQILKVKILKEIKEASLIFTKSNQDTLVNFSSKKTIILLLKLKMKNCRKTAI